jgi:hypothetical protein
MMLTSLLFVQTCKLNETVVALQLQIEPLRYAYI